MRSSTKSLPFCIRAKQSTPAVAMIRSLLILVIVILGQSCRGPKLVQLPAEIMQNNCRHMVTDGNDHAPPGPLDHITLDPLLKEKFSELDLEVAHAFGLLDDLQVHLEARSRAMNDPSVENRLYRLETGMQVQQLLQQAALEVAAISSEMECEKEHAEHMAITLGRLERRAETRLTVAAIVVGAITAVATVLILAEDGQSGDTGNGIEYVGIGSSVIQVGLGVAILKNDRRVDHQHPRNALREVWEHAPVSHFVPPSIWYCLQLPDMNDPEHRPLLDQMEDKWQQMEQVQMSEDSGEGTTPIFFGEGGAYSSEDLLDRARMYASLASFIRLVHQDIEQLAEAVEKLN